MSKFLTTNVSRLELVADPDDVATSLIQFFDRPPGQEVIEHTTDRDGVTHEQKGWRRNPIPLFENWCMENKVTKSRLIAMAQEHDAVAQAVEYGRMAIKTFLVQNGLEGIYDTRMALFVASNETDMKIKSEVTEIQARPSEVLDDIEGNEKPLIPRRDAETKQLIAGKAKTGKELSGKFKRATDIFE